MMLPDWARFCERCGARVAAREGAGDPLKQLELDDTSVEPLWSDADERPSAGEEAAEREAAEHRAALTMPLRRASETSDETELLPQGDPDGQTLLLDPDDAQQGATIDEVVTGDEGVTGPGDQTVLLPQEGSDGQAALPQPREADEDQVVPSPEETGEETALLTTGDAVVEEAPYEEESPADEQPEEESSAEEPPEEEPPVGTDLTGVTDQDPAEDVASEVASAAEAKPEDASEGGAGAPSGDEAAESVPAEGSSGEASAGGSEVPDESPADEGEDEPSDESQQSWQPVRSEQAIDEEGDDAEMGVEPPVRHVSRPWTDHPRPYAKRTAPRPSAPVVPLAVVAALAIVVGFAVALAALGVWKGSPERATAPVERQRVSARAASRVIAGLDGWWKTDRTFDGRRWHIKDGLMETYAADGKLASEVQLDPAAVDRMGSGLGEMEGAGYYLRDIAYYLMDDDPDTLYAIGSDGSVHEGANLLRTDVPDYAQEDSQEPSAEEAEQQEAAASDDYLLPESSTRVYDASELEAMSDHDLFVARNEIYARHGYVFEGGELSEHFGSKTWYHPSDVFNEGEITDIERQNVSVILAVELSRGSQYL